MAVRTSASARFSRSRRVRPMNCMPSSSQGRTAGRPAQRATSSAVASVRLAWRSRSSSISAAVRRPGRLGRSASGEASSQVWPDDGSAGPARDWRPPPAPRGDRGARRRRWPAAPVAQPKRRRRSREGLLPLAPNRGRVTLHRVRGPWLVLLHLKRRSSQRVRQARHGRPAVTRRPVGLRAVRRRCVEGTIVAITVSTSVGALARTSVIDPSSFL